MAASCMRRGPQRRPWVGVFPFPVPSQVYLERGVPPRCISSPTSHIEEEEDAVCTSEEGEFFCCCCNAGPLPVVMFLSFLLHEELLLLSLLPRRWKDPPPSSPTFHLRSVVFLRQNGGGHRPRYKILQAILYYI